LLKLFNGISFGQTQRRNSSIIDNDVYTTGAIERLLDGSAYRSIVGHVHLQDFKAPPFALGQ